MSQRPQNASIYFDADTNFLTKYQKDCYREVVQLFGFDVIYVPIEFVEGDISYVFGEIAKIKYTSAFNIRIKVEGYDELHKALMNYSKFGFFIQPDVLEASVSKEDFDSIVTSVDRPKAGDLILIKIHNEEVLLEVSSCSLKYNSFYLFSIKLYNYDSMTAISTGISSIDGITSEKNQVANLPELDTTNDEIQISSDRDKDSTRSKSEVWGEY